MSPQQVYDMIGGRWLPCTGSIPEDFVPAPADAIGIEFERLPSGGKGNLYYLVAGADEPVRGAGSAYTATYEVLANGLDDGMFYFVSVSTAPSSSFGGLAQYSPCPRQLKLFSSGSNFRMFVGIP